MEVHMQGGFIDSLIGYKADRPVATAAEAATAATGRTTISVLAVPTFPLATPKAEATVLADWSAMRQ